ncbi:MAG: threonylcarbamoyl-AMP synthase [Acetobacteraceae bacterium]|nr:threonylcarbamoyl-AMP synthase [Acetobacteraceae bacterium]
MTALLKPDQTGITEAAALLRAGKLVAFGTETVYGLGADATDPVAVAAIFAAKGRPRFNPLICHYPDPASPFSHVIPNTLAERLAEAFWPGPLTMVLPRRPRCPVALLASAGLDTLAVRVPALPLALDLIRAARVAVAAPSANRSGQISPTRPEHVLGDLGGRIEAVLDCGPCPVGVESTVLDLTTPEPVLLRAGGVALEPLEALIGPIGKESPRAGPARSPGQMESHYAPRLSLRLHATEVGPDEALLAFGPPLAGAGTVFNLSTSGDLIEAASRLFEGLHELDEAGRRLGLARIAAMPVPQRGLGRAINDRLTRAAAPGRDQK